MKWTSSTLAGWLTLAGVSLLLVSGCQTVPVTGRSQLALVPEGQMTELGLSTFQQLKKDTPISHDPEANAMLERVGKRIAAVADLPNAKWEFVLFDSPEANAFCLPGGKVGVYTGILPVTQNDGGLATVIGHEVAHAAAHHGDERMSEAMVMGLGGQVMGSLASGSKYESLMMAAYDAGTKVGRELPHSRAQEAEADHIGIIYMARAGYDPEAAIAFWQRFAAYNQKNGGSQGLWFLRTHPLDDQRIAALKARLPEAEAVYQKHKQ